MDMVGSVYKPYMFAGFVNDIAIVKIPSLNKRVKDKINMIKNYKGEKRFRYNANWISKCHKELYSSIG